MEILEYIRRKRFGTCRSNVAQAYSSATLARVRHKLFQWRGLKAEVELRIQSSLLRRVPFYS